MSARPGWGRLVSTLILVTLGSPAPVLAGDVVLLGVFPDRALVAIDGQRVVLVAGQEGREDVRLLSTNTLERRAWLRIDGQRRELTVAGRAGELAEDPAPAATRIHRDGSGAFSVSGSIGGHAVRFRVDPGAAVTLLNAAEAERVGVAPGQGQLITLRTDRGRAFGQRVILPSVRIGGIALDRVEAVILQGDRPRLPVLGMSFLERVQVREEQGTLLLRGPGR